MTRFKHVLLDRDGVLNVEASTGYVTKIADWRWETNALSALALLCARGLRLSVVTNQSCIGRGLVSRDEVHALHHFVRADAGRAGADISGFFVCEHAPDAACACRKPLPGLALQAVAASGIAAADTILIGDDERDMTCGAAAGVQVALVLTGKGAMASQKDSLRHVAKHRDLLAAAREVLGG